MKKYLLLPALLAGLLIFGLNSVIWAGAPQPTCFTGNGKGPGKPVTCTEMPQNQPADPNLSTQVVPPSTIGNTFIDRGSADSVRVESPLRGRFSFWASISVIIAGVWFLLVLVKDGLKFNFKLKNRVAAFMASPRPALSALVIVFTVTIIGSWLIPPTIVSAERKHRIKSPNRAQFISAKQFGGEGTTQIGKPVFDGEGNQYIYGGFIGKLTIGSTTLTGTHDFDMFVAKLDPEGNPLWLRQGSGATEGVPEEMAIEAAHSLAVDGNGDVYIGGGFVKTLVLQGGKNQGKTLTDSGGAGINYEPFLAKYNVNGDLLWAVGGRSGAGQGNANLSGGANAISSIVLNSEGNPFVSGAFSGTHFLGSAGQSAGLSDAVLAKISPTNGAVVWKEIFGGKDNDNALSLGIDSKNDLYLLGDFASESISISGSEPLKNAGFGSDSYDTFVAKLDPNGKAIWSQHLSNDGIAVGIQLAVTASDEVIITGQFSGSLQIETKEKKELSENNTGEEEADFAGFVAKIDKDGEWVWAESFGGEGEGIALDENGRIYVVGTFFGEVDFDGENSNKADFKSDGSQDQFISAYDQNGDLIWAKAIPGSGTQSEPIYNWAKLGADYKPLGVAYNPSTKSMFITGDFSGNIKFDVKSLNTEGENRHAFLAQLSEGD